MADVEIYADRMTKFAVTQGGTMAKLYLGSLRVDAEGQEEMVTVAVITMSIEAMQDMLTNIVSGVATAQAGEVGPPN